MLSAHGGLNRNTIAYLLDRPEFKHYEGLASLFANRADDRQWKQ